MGKRFVCPNCGGRMVFTPQGDDLICKYCRYTPSVQGDENDVQEQDFIIGMATAKGHNSAVTTKAFDCAACGATYLLSPETLSLTCAYCDSSYTIRSITERKIIPPEGIIPFAITRSRAEDALREKVAVMAENSRIRLEEMQGVYLPVWTFDVRGEVPYTHEDQFTSQISNSTVSVSLDDLLVPASKPLPKSFKKMMPFYNIEKIVSYDPKYLSNWLAETYQIKLSDAALTARAIAVEQTKQEIKNDAIYKISKIKIKSAHLFIHSYKLILLPLWIGQYRLDGKRYEVIINGQSSEVMNDLILEKLSGFKH